jgi:Condensation domain/Phosphopantetheine attachment site
MTCVRELLEGLTMATNNQNSAEARISTLPVERRLLVERMLAGRASRAARVTRRPDPSAAVPLSFQQEPMWLLDQMSGDQALANVPTFIRVSGELDVAAFRKSVAALIGRHEVLRTRCVMTADGPVQFVDEPVGDEPVDWVVADLSELSDADRARRVGDDALRRFDLAAAPIRAGVYRFGERDHVLLIVMHHLASDAHSETVLMRDLTEFYRSFVLGGPADLPPLPIQYPDYAWWQRQSMADERSTALADQRLRALSGVSVEPVLKADRPRAPRRTASGRYYDSVLPRDVARGVLQLSRAERASQFMVLAAMIRVLLWRESGEPDFLVGAPMTDRSGSETQDLIGSFLNMLVLRSPVDQDLTVRELLARERTAVLEAFAQQDLPYEELARRFTESRGRATGSPLFQVTLSYESGEVDLPKLAGLEATRYEPTGAMVPYDLMVRAVGGGENIRLQWGYDDGIFEEDTIARLAKRFTELVARAVAAPDMTVAGLLPGPVNCPPDRAPAPSPTEVTWIFDDDGPEEEWTPLQELVAQVWEELLNRRPRRRSDTFFGLAGHSLELVKLAFRLEEEAGVPVAVADLLEDPTVPAQAAVLESRLRAAFALLGPGEAERIFHEVA